MTVLSEGRLLNVWPSQDGGGALLPWEDRPLDRHARCCVWPFLGARLHMVGVRSYVCVTSSPMSHAG